jgi:hypothetical protein
LETEEKHNISKTSKHHTHSFIRGLESNWETTIICNTLAPLSNHSHWKVVQNPAGASGTLKQTLANNSNQKK